MIDQILQEQAALIEKGKANVHRMTARERVDAYRAHQEWVDAEMALRKWEYENHCTYAGVAGGGEIKTDQSACGCDELSVAEIANFCSKISKSKKATGVMFSRMANAAPDDVYSVYARAAAYAVLREESPHQRYGLPGAYAIADALPHHKEEMVHLFKMLAGRFSHMPLGEFIKGLLLPLANYLEASPSFSGSEDEGA